MAEEQFWGLIAKLDWKRPSEEEVVEPLIAALAESSPTEIEGFHERLRDVVRRIGGEPFARAAEVRLEDGRPYFSSDHFLDLRCDVVAGGEISYRRVLGDPSQFPAGEGFEVLVKVAEVAYRRKTGRVKLFRAIE